MDVPTLNVRLVTVVNVQFDAQFITDTPNVRDLIFELLPSKVRQFTVFPLVISAPLVIVTPPFTFKSSCNDHPPPMPSKIIEASDFPAVVIVFPIEVAKCESDPVNEKVIAEIKVKDPYTFNALLPVNVGVIAPVKSKLKQLAVPGIVMVGEVPLLASINTSSALVGALAPLEPPLTADQLVVVASQFPEPPTQYRSKKVIPVFPLTFSDERKVIEPAPDLVISCTVRCDADIAAAVEIVAALAGVNDCSVALFPLTPLDTMFVTVWVVPAVRLNVAPAAI